MFLKLILAFFIFESAGADTAKPVEFQLESMAGYDTSAITSDALTFEEQQYFWVNQWNIVSNQLQQAKLKSDYLKKSFNRSEKLAKSNHISAEAFVIAQFQYDSSKNEIKRLEADVEKATANTSLVKLQLQAEAQPKEDFRRRITEARLQVYKAQLASLEAQLATVETEEALCRQKLKNTKGLADKRIVSMQEFETREFNVLKAAQEAVGLKSQIGVTKLAIEALEKTLARL